MTSEAEKSPPMEMKPQMEQQQQQAVMSSESSTVAEVPPSPAAPEEKAKRDWSPIALAVGHSLCAFLIGLDRAILATAIPEITSDFNSLDDVGWYSSSFMLTMACFQLFFGKLYVELPIKTVYLSAIAIFEVGSIVCAATPNSGGLIAGRAVAGFGATGLLSGGFVIVAYTVPLHRRPQFAGLLGGAVGIGQSIAPTLGGVFTDRLNWRWCFWINLPIGAVTFLLVALFVKINPGPDKPPPTLSSFAQKYDIIGTALMIPWVVCLLLALQWGGSQHAWGSWRIILLLVLFAALFPAWVYSQIRQGDKATLPVRIITQRSMVAGIFYMFCLIASFFIVIYYVPIWFQAVRNDSAYQSGINFLTTSVSTSVAVLVAGFVTSLIGYYVPHMLGGSVLTLAGCLMAYFFQPDTSDAFWVSALVVSGIGIGIGVQQPIMAAQAVFKGTDIVLATSVVLFCQSLATTIFLCVGQNVFQTQLVSQLASRAPGVDPTAVIDAGAAQLHEAMAERYPDQLDGIIQAYNDALRRVFLICAILAGLSFLGSTTMEWVSVKKDKKPKENEPKDVEKAEGKVAEEESKDKA